MREIVKLFLLSLFFVPRLCFGADSTYSGVVVDENGETLVGANIVSVSNSEKGCSTDLEGKFTDCKLPDNKVQISFVGYKTQTIDLQESSNNIKLEPNIEELNEVQTIGDKSAMSQQARDCIDSGGKMETNGEDTAACVCPADKPLNGQKCGGDDSTEPEGEIKENTTPVDTAPVVADGSDGASGGNNNAGGNGNNNQGQANKNDEPKKDEIADKKKAYEDAKATEQSTANKTLTALTTAATGIGGMELAMGLSEKKSDEAAEQDMKAYLLTFRCTYANGKNVKGGPDEIELPGGNDEKLMSMRSEYVALAADLKERKEALGMKPGIEAEKIYDKA
ncbi:MAG: carboxypeptidase-like regulatory domain-containing protein, partial [Alphaproteobacteria bacterium]|nr:carboxypeptidase-like regulatory domain-containing protein [Alphaproteobacteria bacterium]